MLEIPTSEVGVDRMTGTRRTGEAPPSRDQTGRGCEDPHAKFATAAKHTLTRLAIGAPKPPVHRVENSVARLRAHRLASRTTDRGIERRRSGHRSRCGILRLPDDRIGVILLALFLGRQDGVSVTERLKPGLGVASRIAVGVQFHRERAVRGLDLRCAGARFQAERSIIASVIPVTTATSLVIASAHR